MNYGFVIDNRKCIGCHACSTACKSENEVPLGVARTWVKYTEVGQYPDVRRHFQVTRCNHCANPPCVRICPVTAMYQRDDGIVEFDSNVCIGCKACMQACPYDAIHIDPQTKTAAKCHFCAHRTEVGLEPACVVVCPEHAIIAGDMDDNRSEISKVLAGHSVTVRKPEQGTAPKVYYIEGHDASLTPTATQPKAQNFMWSEAISEQWDGKVVDSGDKPATEKKVLAHSGAALRAPQEQGHPLSGPIKMTKGTVAEQMVQVVYNFQHKVPWHWPVPMYLVTKGIAAGIFLILAAFFVWSKGEVDSLTAVVGGGLSILATLITTILLVIDLERPERFLRIIFRPQMRSWLARGAFLLIAFSMISGLWWVLELAHYLRWLQIESLSPIRNGLFLIGMPFAVGAAIYTAFLFGQAEGRDLWQSPLLPVHLMIQALLAGSGSLLLVDAAIGLPLDLAQIVSNAFYLLLVVDFLTILFAEFAMPHSSEVAAQAAHSITHGEFKYFFWIGAIVIGHVIPLLSLWSIASVGKAMAGVAMLVGLYCYEYAFVMAPQKIPNS